MCRLQKLLRLVCRTTRRQDELVNHDLMFEFIHFRRKPPCPTRGDWLWNRLSTVVFFFYFFFFFPTLSLFFTLVVFRFLFLSRPPLQPVEQTQIFTVGAVVEGASRDWREGAANQRRVPPVGFVCCKRRVLYRRVFNRRTWLCFDTLVNHKQQTLHLCERSLNYDTYMVVKSPRRRLNPHSGNLRTGLFWTTTPVSTRFVCKAAKGWLFCEWRPLSSNSHARCVTILPNMVNKSTIANYIARS